MNNIYIRDHEDFAGLSHLPKSIFHTRNFLFSVKHSLRIFPVTILLTSMPHQANAVDSFQEKMLFDPPESMLLAEARGRIMIYDGLDSNSVNRAMDEQFNRIDNMMFTRIHHAQENGEVEIEDDGCD